MDTESKFSQQGLAIDYTPAGAVLAGALEQMADGRAGIVVEDIAAGVLGAAQVMGIYEIKQKAEILNNGDIVGWDQDGNPYDDTAGTGALTKYLADADFLVGKVQVTTTATTKTAFVNLNELGQYGPVTYTQRITSAQVLLLATTQISLVPAPGADKAIEVLGIQMILDYGTNVFTEPSAPDDLEVVYDTAGGVSLADVIGDFIINAADTIAQPVIKDIAGSAASGIVNKAVVLDNNGTDYGGNAGDDSILIVKTTCIIHQCELA